MIIMIFQKRVGKRRVLDRDLVPFVEQGKTFFPCLEYLGTSLIGG